MEKFKTEQEITKSIKAHLGQIGTGRRGLHQDLLNLSRRIAEYGDHTIAVTAVQLINDDDFGHTEAVPVVKWLGVYAGIAFDKDEETGVVTSTWQGAQFIKDNFEGGKTNPYYAGVKKVDPFTFDLEEAVQKVITAANNAKKKATTQPDAVVSINDAQYEALKAVLKAA